MDQELKDRWVAALRSGEYKQEYGRLRSLSETGDTYFCCLGVLCDLVDSSKWDGPAYRYSDEEAFIALPPKDIRQAVGLSLRDVNELASTNDRGVPFAQIADLIECLEREG